MDEDDDRDLPAPVPVGALTAWHASPRAKDALGHMEHVGTRRAALERGLTLGRGFVLHEVRLAGGPALAIRDGVGSTHRLGGMIEEMETLLDLPFSFAGDLLTRNRGDDPDVAANLARAATDRGYALLTYVNAVEDAGSASFVVLDPASAPVVSRSDLTQAEAEHELSIGEAPAGPRGP